MGTEFNGQTVSLSTERLEELGLTKAAKIYKDQLPTILKMTIAKEHYRFVTPENFERAKQEIKDATLRVTREDISLNRYRETMTYCRIKLILLENYEGIPPKLVLDRLEEAKKLGCFDDFEIAVMERVEEHSEHEKPRRVPDPILFGRICGNWCRFFIAQWGDDISIDQILKPSEG